MQEEFLEEVEEWRDVAGYNGAYQVSNMGRVMSVDRFKVTKLGKQSVVKGAGILTQRTYRNYKELDLSLNGKAKTHRVHRLVCAAFHDNPENKPYVNHIDFDTTNNKATNLEWCTPLENVNHSKHRMYNPVTGNFGADHPLSKSIDVYEVCIRKIGEYGSYIEAAASINKPKVFVSSCIKSKYIRIKDFVFATDDTIKTKIGDVLVWTDVMPTINKK